MCHVRHHRLTLFYLNRLFEFISFAIDLVFVELSLVFVSIFSQGKLFFIHILTIQLTCTINKKLVLIKNLCDNSFLILIQFILMIEGSMYMN